MPPVLRSLPPLSPRYPSPSGRTKVGSNANEVEDPAPQHLHPVSPLDGDVAETRDLDSEVVTAESCKQVWDEVLNSNSHYNNENSANGATSTTNTNAMTNNKLVFWRGKKVSSTDVASVGNASDTGIELRNQSVSTTGRALHESAKVALNSGNFMQALELFEAILEAQIKRFGTRRHASVAAAMHNVGVCRQRMGHHTIAETLLVEATQIREHTLGKYHVEVAASLSKLGSVRISLGRFEEAFVDLRKALHIAQAQQEPGNNKSSKTVAQMQCHLACLYFEKGELFAAQATFQDALDIYRKVWKQEIGDNNAAAQSSSNKTRDALMLQLTDTLCNIGSILNRRKCFGQAITNFQEALDLQKGILENDHPRIISTLDNLAYSYSKNREYARAVTCYRTMLRAQISQSGTFTEECLLTFRKRVLMYDKLRLVSEAINDTKDVLRLQKTLLPKDDALVLETKALLEELVAKKKSQKAAKRQQPQPVEC
mmetsp:Transcript_22257/g.61834  ORF Transcript_22257/g.61834 Transcript_22257/m.61834 type:complete len:485 (+) Transcript_22257:237-1691(+)